MRSEQKSKLLVLELSAAEKYFLDHYIAAQELPVFEKLLKEGVLLKTKVSTLDAPLTPFSLWPSIYTGLSPAQHNIVGFSQQVDTLQNRFLWRVLNEKGITTGVFNPGVTSKSFQHANNLFYRSMSDVSQNDYFGLRTFIKQKIFLKQHKQLNTMPKAILQQMADMQHQMDQFYHLYIQHQPQFSSLHLEHLGAAQRLYWRATGVDTFSEELSPLERYYFQTLENRNDQEFLFKDVILNFFKLVDRFLEKLLLKMDHKTLLCIVTGLGQSKRDPVYQTHKPVIMFHHLKDLFGHIKIPPYQCLMEQNPKITINFNCVEEANLGVYLLSQLHVLGEYPLFTIEQRETQLFISENLAPEIWFVGEKIWIENKANDAVFPLFDYIQLSQLKDQQTADYTSTGWILCYGLFQTLLPKNVENLDIMDIYPLLLQYFNVKVPVNR